MSQDALAAHTPPQVAPVTRPFFTQPHESVDATHGDLLTLLKTRMELMHGANHDDPAAWGPASYGDRMVRR